jgi:putative flippase GtrA
MMRRHCQGQWFRLVRFALVGLAGAAVFYLVLWTLVEHAQVAVMPATSIAFLLVIAENYVLHRRWTFRSADSHSQTLPPFVILSAAGFGINAALMWFGTERYRMNYMLLQGFAIAVVVCCNLVGTYWVFARRDAGRPTSQLGTDDVN